MTALRPIDIYKFYYYAFKWQMSETGSEITSRSIVSRYESELDSSRSLWLEAFIDLIKEQLYKYKSKDRLDRGAYTREDVGVADPDELLEYMGKTYRGDMERRNERWIDLCKHVRNLNNSFSTKDIIFNIDRINNVIHNNKTTILDKFPNHEALYAAFEFAHNCREEEDLRKRAMGEIDEKEDLRIKRKKLEKEMLRKQEEEEDYSEEEES